MVYALYAIFLGCDGREVALFEGCTREAWKLPQEMGAVSARYASKRAFVRVEVR